MATALAQTITVVRGKKVISTSKHWVGLYKEAKTAYLEKKAELKTAREDDFQKRLGAIRDADELASQGGTPVHSRNTSRENSRNRERASRPSPGIARSRTVEHGYGDGYFPYGNHESQFLGSHVNLPYDSELVRRHSSSDIAGTSNYGIAAGPITPEGMNFAYGGIPPPLPLRRIGDDDELRMKMFTLNRMLEEAHCVQHSAKAIIKSLETNPEAMAAVALTLAEISNLAKKMAPGALIALRGSFPAVIALLASPEFLIAVGVGVGLTVVALGGYKIIKRIQTKKQLDGDLQTDELEEITGDLDSIEAWRRGISDADAQSVGTSVEGEFITPGALQHLKELGIIPKKDAKSKKAGKQAKQTRYLEGAQDVSRNEQVQVRDKETSGLRMLFRRNRQDSRADRP